MSKSSLSPLEHTVQKNMQEYFPAQSSPLFVLAVSGGKDSMSLLHVFKELDIAAVVSHINYQKRGEASDKDAELVRKISAEWGFEYHVTEANPKKAGNENFQQWARNLRYEVFSELVTEYHANGIAVAHHEDDQVETILQKMFRGAGLASWSGMQVWDGQIFRPLLPISRTQIDDYVHKNGIPFRTDESNLEADFARNFLRNEWLDKLDDFFPGWKKNVLWIANQADNFEKSIEWIANCIVDAKGIKREDFDSLDPGLQRSLILYLLKQRQPGLQISKESLSRVNELADLQTGSKLELIPEVSLIRDRAHYVVEVGEIEDFPVQQIERKQLQDAPCRIGELEISLTGYENPDFEKALYLDAQKVSWPLTIRRWRNGDEFQPLGMEGHQLVSDHLTNRKISAAHKTKALVVESFEETICAIIFPPIKNQTPPGTISERFKCETETDACLEIKIRK